MAIELKRTKDVHSNGVKMIVFGQAGSGKTTLIKTLPNPVTLSAESGLLSLQDQDLPYIEVTSYEKLQEAYEWLATGEGQQFESVALDSISEIAEVVLNKEMEESKDGRKAYGEMGRKMQVIIRAFRDLPGRNVYMTAKLEKSTDEQGRMMYSPSMPGNTIGQMLPYFFDDIFALRVEKDGEGNPQRSLQCQPDGLWYAKDRGAIQLPMWMAPDLGEIIKIKSGGQNGTD